MNEETYLTESLNERPQHVIFSNSALVPFFSSFFFQTSKKYRKECLVFSNFYGARADSSSNTIEIKSSSKKRNF